MLHAHKVYTHTTHRYAQVDTYQVPAYLGMYIMQSAGLGRVPAWPVKRLECAVSCYLHLKRIRVVRLFANVSGTISRPFISHILTVLQKTKIMAFSHRPTVFRTFPFPFDVTALTHSQRCQIRLARILVLRPTINTHPPTTLPIDLAPSATVLPSSPITHTPSLFPFSLSSRSFFPRSVESPGLCHSFKGAGFKGTVSPPFCPLYLSTPTLPALHMLLRVPRWPSLFFPAISCPFCISYPHSITPSLALFR